ncbi:MAG: hypothetical protein N3G79_01590 [Sulfolobales archaeon]|nr:hypothetical protein [Sulfolobales archaeon]
MKKLELDLLGERGEYHTLVLSSSLHRSKLSVKVVGALEYGDYEILVAG